MYKMEYDNHGALMMGKIEEVCLFTPKAVDGMIARLRAPTGPDPAAHAPAAERRRVAGRRRAAG